MDKIHIAQVAHQVIRVYSASIGDTPAPAWADANKAQREGLLAGVDMHLANPDTTPEAAHEAWLADKLAKGWKIGEKRDDKKKLHPNLMPYADLPAAQKAKDHIFRGLVHAMAALPEPEPQIVEKVVEKIVEVPAVLSKLSAGDIYAQIDDSARSGIAALVVQASPAQAPPPVDVPAGHIAVRYIGRRETWTDRHYGSGLSFASGQTRNVPKLIAGHFLRHVDLFESGDETAAEAEAVVLQTDNTQAQLDQAAKERDQVNEAMNRRQDMVDRVNSTDANGLVDHAMTSYRIQLDPKVPIDQLRAEVIGLIDRFGIV